LWLQWEEDNRWKQMCFWILNLKREISFLCCPLVLVRLETLWRQAWILCPCLTPGC
jgi:hypothetical protein